MATRALDSAANFSGGHQLQLPPRSASPRNGRPSRPAGRILASGRCSSAPRRSRRSWIRTTWCCTSPPSACTRFRAGASTRSSAWSARRSGRCSRAAPASPASSARSASAWSRSSASRAPRSSASATKKGTVTPPEPAGVSSQARAGDRRPLWLRPGDLQSDPRRRPAQRQGAGLFLVPGLPAGYRAQRGAARACRAAGGVARSIRRAAARGAHPAGRCSIRRSARLPEAAAWQQTESFLESLLDDFAPQISELIALRGIRYSELVVLDRYSRDLPGWCARPVPFTPSAATRAAGSRSIEGSPRTRKRCAPGRS